MNIPKIKIANPMTIIAIFAALTEASATASLPFLDDSDRDVYIWFLISFPFSLMLFFFVTLNFNYKSLYAPSDFKKGQDFIKVIDDATRSKKDKETLSNISAKKQHNDCPAGTENPIPPTRLLKCPPQSFIFRQQKRRYSSGNAQDPPALINLFINHAVQHTLCLPETLHGLHIIDTRWITTKKDADTLMTEIGKKVHNTPATRDLIIFLTHKKSAQLINKIELENLYEDEHRQPSYMMYNLSTRALIQTGQMNVQHPTY
jgi:hypothetical protein